jgi:hypothetical protein
MTDSFTVHLDRLAFTPVRAFVVSGPPEGATRGGHPVPCREQIVLVAGRVEMRYRGETVVLAEPGATMLLEPGEPMEYDLAPGGSTILVLADEPYEADGAVW